jgi:tetratricopeptide (TPR) repeat protein
MLFRVLICGVIVGASSLLAADGDQWGIAAANKPDAPLYRRHVDAERAWFMQRVAEPCLAQTKLPADQAGILKRSLALWATVRVTPLSTDPVSVVQAIDDLRPVIDAAGQPDPIPAYVAERFIEGIRKWDREAWVAWNCKTRDLWLADPTRWEAIYPASLQIEVDNACLGSWRRAQNPNEAGHIKVIAERLATWYEKAWRNQDFAGRDRALVDLCRQATTQQDGAPVWIPRVLALVRDRDDWLAHMVRGNLAITEAWVGRGNAAASEVTEEGWNIFRERLSYAEQEFEAANRLNADLPEAPANLILTAFQHHERQQAVEWFQRAIAREFDYPWAYTTMIHFLRPRWYGSEVDQADFGRACLETKRFDTMVPAYVVRCLTNNHGDMPDDKFAWTYGTSAWKQRMKNLADGYEAVHGAQTTIAGQMRTDQALFLWAVHDQAGALAVIRTIPPAVVAWSRCLDWNIKADDIREALAGGAPILPQPNPENDPAKF